MYVYRNIYMFIIYSCIIHNSQKGETIQISINWWDEKCGYLYNEILLSNQKDELLIKTTSKMKEP